MGAASSRSPPPSQPRERARDTVAVSHEEGEFFRLAHAAVVELEASVGIGEAERGDLARWRDALGRLRCVRAAMWRAGCRADLADHGAAYAALVSLQRLILATSDIPAEARATHAFMAAPDPADVAAAERALQSARRTGWYALRKGAAVGGARDRGSATPVKPRAAPACYSGRDGKTRCAYGRQGRSYKAPPPPPKPKKKKA